MKITAAFLLLCVSIIKINAQPTLIPENAELLGEEEVYDVIIGDQRLEKAAAADGNSTIEAFVTFPSDVNF